MENYTKKTKRELLRAQLRTTGTEEDFKEIVKDGLTDDILIDDSFANIMRLVLFSSGSEDDEELLIALNFTREKFRRMIAEK